MKLIVTGGAGLVGRAVREHCERRGDQVISYDHKQLDIADQEAVVKTVSAKQPDAIINCAAWTDVDGCESDERRAFAANAEGPENLAVACRESGALLITISTDYVFDGRKEGFYTQRDQPHPESVYARSKLEGERRAQQAWARTTVVRTGFIFGAGGTNFLSTIFERIRGGHKLKAITDSFGTPTYSVDLAARLRELAELDLPAIFHVTNAGTGASFADFAQQALELTGAPTASLELIKTSDLDRPAPRPMNSRLKCLFSEPLGLTPLPLWTDALKAFALGTSPAEVGTRA